MTSDGGCSESLNVHLIDGETAPVLTPEDKTSLYGPEAAKGLTGPALYIHKGLGYDNLIFLDNPSGTVMAYKKGSTGRESALSLYTLKSGETINKVTSVGNTVILCTNQRMEYALYKEGKYKGLGDQIPVPMVEFRTTELCNENDSPGLINGYRGSGTVILMQGFKPRETPKVAASGPIRQWSAAGTGITSSTSSRITSDSLKEWDELAWSKYLSGEIDSSDYKGAFLEVCNAVWDILTLATQRVKKQGYFCTPVFARYALRLYDGSYIYQSVPVLLGAGNNRYFSAKGILTLESESEGTWESMVKASLSCIYSVKAFLKEYNYDGWEDIVSSIDLFLSTDVHYPLLNSEIKGLTLDSSNSISGQNLVYDLSFDEDDEDLMKERRRNEILSKSNFYRIETFGSERMSKLEEGYNLMSRDEFISQDYLVTQPTLPDDYMSHHRKIAENVFQYNNKVIMTGITSEISSGYQYINGPVLRNLNTDGWTTKKVYGFHFYMRDSSNNELNVLGRNAEGGTQFKPYSATYIEPVKRHNGAVNTRSGESSESVTGAQCYAQPYCWLAYPDSRCYRVDVTVTEGEGDEAVTTTRSYDMEPHPLLNLSYVLLEMDEKIGSAGGTVDRTGNVSRSTSSSSSPTSTVNRESREYKETNVIWASEMNNPFVFPAEGKITFVAEVISIANATAALSEGQFGQYPLYVFTKDGIWSVPVSNNGDFAASVPMSRDVALSKESIQTIEQAITFATAQGVMLLSGSTVQSISPNMEGEHYVSPADLVTLLGKDANLGELSEAFSGDTPFKAFLRSGCKTAFDYAGRRVFFFTDAYTYVYRIESQTWHKLSLDGEGVTMQNALNSYPDCYICCKRKDADRYLLYDFSVEYSDDAAKQQKTLPGLIVTRPFDLELPDVRKTITALRIRGHFNRKDVQYILLGSMDGLSWGILPSLRGGSYKLYRIALVLNLAAGERVSWIDVEYEERLNNRMR